MRVRVSDAVSIGSVVVRPQWKSFEESVTGLVDRLVSVGRLPDHLAATAIERVCEREAMASTAMVDIAIGIPHARLEGIDGIIAALAVHPVAVYQVADRLPIAIVMLVLSAPNLSGQHLTFLSAVSLLLQSSRTRSELRTAETVEAVLEVIRRNEQVR